MYVYLISLIVTACSKDHLVEADHLVSWATPENTISLDGRTNDWSSITDIHYLVDRNKKKNSISFKLTHADQGGALFLLISGPERPQKIEVFLDLSNDTVLDRPVQYIFQKKLQAAQAAHSNAVQVEMAGITPFEQEWKIDLDRLGIKMGKGDIVHIGFDIKVVTSDGKVLKWGQKNNKWLFDRRLKTLSLVPAGTLFGRLQGMTQWSGDTGRSPPQRIIITLDDSDHYIRAIETDPQTGAFDTTLPAGQYHITTYDSRTAPDYATEQAVIILANETNGTETLKISRPNRDNLPILIKNTMERDHINALGLVYIQNGIVKISRAFGSMPDGSPVNETAIFKMASLSKPVAAMTVLTLIEKGLWSLNEPLANYWVDPGISNDPRHKLITTQMILHHTSGLPNQTGNGPLEFLFDPGERQSYSGEGYRYLSRAVEQKFGKPFQDIAKEYVFKPAGMTCSSFQGPIETCGEYVQKFHNHFKFDPPLWEDTDVKGGWMTTVPDMQAFLFWVLNGAGLSAKTWAKISQPNPRILLKDDSGAKDLYGLGWAISHNDELIIYHGGSEFGARTYMILLPESNSGIIIATNGAGGLPVTRMIIEATLKDENQLVDIEGSLARSEKFEW